MNSSSIPPICASEITGLVLAGGRGSRMGGIDKGLQNFRGTALALHALRRLAPQVGRMGINANRNLPIYASFGVPVWPDDVPDYAGPLAGFLAGLTRCETPYLLTVPCDVPLFPNDLASRLAQALHHAEGADIAMASAPETQADGTVQWHPQPVFCLLRSTLCESLARFVQQGGRKISAWTAQHRGVTVPFDHASDVPDAFANINTLAELQAMQGQRT